MSSPYSTNLLQQSVDTTEAPARPVQHTTHVTRVMAAPQPMPVAPPQPQVVYAVPARRGNAVTALALGLVVILLGAVALVGAYYAARNASPSATEASLTQGIAMREGFRAGRDRGVQTGLEQAVGNASEISRLRIAAAREQAYAAAFRRGERAGRRYTRPSYSYGGSRGYRAPRYSYSGGDVVAAFGQAQNLANMTGAPVDIEVY